jgi:alanine racemase
MGAIKPENFKRMSFKRVALVCHDMATIRALGATQRKVSIHIEIETGMTRHGVSMPDLPVFLKEIAKYKNIHLEGVMTHLADADNAEDDAYNQQQTATFDSAVATVLEAGFTPAYIHIAQSAGSPKITSTYANTLRVGLALYGINPLDAADASYDRLATALQPALTLTSTVTKVQAIERGITVSYARTFKAAGPTRIGVLPLGYYEGVPRALSNSGQVQFGNSYLSIAGRVCMNHTMIDITHSKAAVGDRVTVISADKISDVTVERICQKHGLFTYSLLTGLNQTIRRRVVS